MRHPIRLALALSIGGCAQGEEPAPTPPDPAPPPSAPAPAPDPIPPAPPPADLAPTHVHLDRAERRSAPDGNGVVALLAEGHEAFVGRLELEPLAEIPPHRDPTEEYIVILEGGGTMLVDGRAYQLRTGSAVFLPAGVEVSFANGPQRLIALQVFAGPASARKYDAWPVQPADPRPPGKKGD